MVVVYCIKGMFWINAMANVIKYLLHAKTVTSIYRIYSVTVFYLHAGEVQLICTSSVRLWQTDVFRL